MIRYTGLGSTGIYVSNLCLGTMTFGQEANPKDAEHIYHACRDKGINFFDTSNNYSQGEAERILGRLMAPERSQIIVATKVSSATGPDINARGWSRRHIMSAVEQSLQRLQTDYIDLYLLHHFDAHTPLEEALRAMHDLVTQGKIHYIGVSNFAAWQVQKALGIGHLNNWHLVQCLQPMYSLIKRQAEVELLPMAQAEGLGVMTYSPLAAGLLTGKYASDTSPATGRLTTNVQYQKRYSEDWAPTTAEEFGRLAREHGYSPISLAIAWVNYHPAVTAAIIGARHVEQIQDALASVDIAMTDDLYACIARLSPTPPLATDRAEEAHTDSQ